MEAWMNQTCNLNTNCVRQTVSPVCEWREKMIPLASSTLIYPHPHFWSWGNADNVLYAIVSYRWFPADNLIYTEEESEKCETMIISWACAFPWLHFTRFQFSFSQIFWQKILFLMQAAEHEATLTSSFTREEGQSLSFPIKVPSYVDQKHVFNLSSCNPPWN